MIIAITFMIGILALVAVGVRITSVVRGELRDSLEKQRVAEHVAVARMRLRRLNHDAMCEMYDAAVDPNEH